MHKTIISQEFGADEPPGEGPEDLFTFIYNACSAKAGCIIFTGPFDGRCYLAGADGRSISLDKVKNRKNFQLVADLALVRIIGSEIKEFMQQPGLTIIRIKCITATGIGADLLAFDKAIFFFMCELCKVKPATVRIIKQIIMSDCFKHVIEQDHLLQEMISRTPLN